MINCGHNYLNIFLFNEFHDVLIIISFMMTDIISTLDLVIINIFQLSTERLSDRQTDPDR